MWTIDPAAPPQAVECPCGDGEATKRPTFIMDRDRADTRQRRRIHVYRHDCGLGGHLVTVAGEIRAYFGPLFPNRQATLRGRGIAGELPHRDGDGRRTVTLERCNAIRCAVADGRSYGYIAQLFDLSVKCVLGHATGTHPCSHTGNLPPVESQHERGPPTGTISPGECDAIRRTVREGNVQTYAELADTFERERNVVWRHATGNCHHGGPAVEPPELEPEALVEYRQRQGWTQAEFADRLGVPRSTLSSWEQGRNAIRTPMAYAIRAEVTAD